jgi:uncharacterized protein (DUF486 family)
MKAVVSIALLIAANVFMVIAWYAHLRLKDFSWFEKLPFVLVILISWCVALPEYLLQVPANRLGYNGTGGPFSLWQLKVMQECITLVVFTVFATLVFKNETLRFNHAVSAVFLVLAVWFAFKE